MVERTATVDYKVRVKEYYMPHTFLGLRLGLGFWFSHRLRFWLRFRFGFWFSHRLWLRLGLRFGLRGCLGLGLRLGLCLSLGGSLGSDLNLSNLFRNCAVSCRARQVPPHQPTNQPTNNNQQPAYPER